jgi:hypothetical protein
VVEPRGLLSFGKNSLPRALNLGFRGAQSPKSNSSPRKDDFRFLYRGSCFSS